MEEEPKLQYEIQQPTVDDVDGWIAVHVQSWLDTYPNEAEGVTREYIQEYMKRHTSDEGRERRLNMIRASYDNPNYYLRVAKDKSGKIVGFIDAMKGEKFELLGLYLDTVTHGSGLAHTLAEQALEWLGRENDITLIVVAYNERAQAFYKKLGFEKVLGSENFYDNTPLNVIEMVRKGDA